MQPKDKLNILFFSIFPPAGCFYSLPIPLSSFFVETGLLQQIAFLLCLSNAPSLPAGEKDWCRHDSPHGNKEKISHPQAVRTYAQNWARPISVKRWRGVRTSCLNTRYCNCRSYFCFPKIFMKKKIENQLALVHLNSFPCGKVNLRHTEDWFVLFSLNSREKKLPRFIIAKSCSKVLQ